MAFNTEEINTLSFISALKNDKRKYCDYYISLIKTKHILVFNFCSSGDYNSKIVKIELSFIIFIVALASNALFFNDYIINQIYYDKGSYNFLLHLKHIIISALISYIFFILLRLFALSEGKIIDFKTYKNKANLNKRVKEYNKKLKIQYILYFIFILILLLLLGYYLALFGLIYRYSQKHLILNAIMSLIFLFFVPLLTYLIPMIFRMLGLSNKNEMIYKICLILQLLV